MKKDKVTTPIVTGNKYTDALLHDEQVNQNLRPNEVILHSISTVLNTKTATLYPLFKDGTVDGDNEFFLEDCEFNPTLRTVVQRVWWNKLSDADFDICEKTLYEYGGHRSDGQDVMYLKRLLEECMLTIDGYNKAMCDNSDYKRKYLSDLIKRIRCSTGHEEQ
tara:strand:+ start:438 stop:926 length:489 start_codon:yes stop_codon:yes gene_type:complete